MEFNKSIELFFKIDEKNETLKHDFFELICLKLSYYEDLDSGSH